MKIQNLSGGRLPRVAECSSLRFSFYNIPFCVEALPELGSRVYLIVLRPDDVDKNQSLVSIEYAVPWGTENVDTHLMMYVRSLCGYFDRRINADSRVGSKVYKSLDLWTEVCLEDRHCWRPSPLNTTGSSIKLSRSSLKDPHHHFSAVVGPESARVQIAKAGTRGPSEPYAILASENGKPWVTQPRELIKALNVAVMIDDFPKPAPEEEARLVLGEQQDIPTPV